MLNLAERYWQWRESITLERQVKQAELEKAQLLRKLYGKYLDQAAKSNDSPLYPVSEQCTQLFITCVESGVTSVENDEYESTATFGNGYKVAFWNANKMYAYAKRARFIDNQGNKTNFEKEMPELWCCYMILDKIEDAKI
jgi:hypothetical protein